MGSHCSLSPLPFPKPLVSVLPNPPDLPSLLLQGRLPGEVFPGLASKTGPLPGTPWPSSLVYFFLLTLYVRQKCSFLFY